MRRRNANRLMINAPRLIYSVRTLKEGPQSIKVKLDNLFFGQFEKSEIEGCNIILNVHFDKKPGMVVVDLDFHGSVKDKCDRCITSISLPVEGEDQIFVKFGNSEKSTDALIFLKDENQELDLTDVVHELILLSIPLKKTYDCDNDENPPCDFEVLKSIEDNSFDVADEEPKKGIWDALKDLNN